MIAIALPIYPESFILVAATVFPNRCDGNKHRNKETHYIASWLFWLLRPINTLTYLLTFGRLATLLMTLN